MTSGVLVTAARAGDGSVKLVSAGKGNGGLENVTQKMISRTRTLETLVVEKAGGVGAMAGSMGISLGGLQDEEGHKEPRLNQIVPERVEELKKWPKIGGSSSGGKKGGRKAGVRQFHKDELRLMWDDAAMHSVLNYEQFWGRYCKSRANYYTSPWGFLSPVSILPPPLITRARGDFKYISPVLENPSVRQCLIFCAGELCGQRWVVVQ